MALSRKQQAFISEYLIDFNATEAAIRAGYSGRTAYSIGWENLRKPEIEEAIRQRLQEKAMLADEVLMRLAEQARGSLGDFLKRKQEDSPLLIDLDQAALMGKLHLVKKVKQRSLHRLLEDGEMELIEVQAEIELHDPQKALELLGKHHGLFKEQVEHSGGLELTVDDPRDELMRRINRLAARSGVADGNPGDDAG